MVWKTYLENLVKEICSLIRDNYISIIIIILLGIIGELKELKDIILWKYIDFLNIDYVYLVIFGCLFALAIWYQLYWSRNSILKGLAIESIKLMTALILLGLFILLIWPFGDNDILIEVINSILHLIVILVWLLLIPFFYTLIHPTKK